MFAVQAVRSALLLFGAVTISVFRITAVAIFRLLGFTLFGFTGIYYSCVTALVSE